MSYASIVDLTTYLGIDDSTADDGLLTALLARATAVIAAYTRRTFVAASDTTRYHSAVQGRILPLDGDLCAVTTIVNGDGRTVPGSEYTTDPRNAAPWWGIVLRPSSPYEWDVASGDIAVTGRWAYSVTAPQDIVHACVRLAAWMYRQKDNVGSDSAMVAGNVTILPSRLPADVVELLRPYVRVTL